MNDIFQEGNVVECVTDRMNNYEEGRRYEVGKTRHIRGKEQVTLYKLHKTQGTKLKDFHRVNISEDQFNREGFFNGRNGMIEVFQPVDGRITGKKKSSENYKEKAKIGLPQKKYTAKKKGSGANQFWSMRIDSAMKLILNFDGWDSTQLMTYDGMNDASRTLEKDYTPMNQEDKEFFKDRIDNGRYHASVYPEENKIEISNHASTVYGFKHPDLELKK